MYQIKKRVFADLTKTQKADFLSFVKIYVKNFSECDAQSIYNNLLDEIAFFQEPECGRFSYIDLNSQKHADDIMEYVKACKRYFDYKEAQRPFYEEQKRIQKEIRHKIRDERQKKEPPTKKQISYYKSLCKANNETPQTIEELSKFDIKLEISRLAGENEPQI